MEVLHPRCAGLDISMRDAKVCVRVAGDLFISIISNL